MHWFRACKKFKFRIVRYISYKCWSPKEQSEHKVAHKCNCSNFRETQLWNKTLISSCLQYLRLVGAKSDPFHNFGIQNDTIWWHKCVISNTLHAAWFVTPQNQSSNESKMVGRSVDWFGFDGTFSTMRLCRFLTAAAVIVSWSTTRNSKKQALCNRK